MLEKWKSYKNTVDLGKQCRHLGRRRKAELAGAAVGGKPCEKAKNSSGGELITSSPILSGGTVASSPAGPYRAWAEENTHGMDSVPSRVAVEKEEDSASNKALEVKGSSVRELSEGRLLPARHRTGEGKPPACPHPAWRRQKKGTRGNEEGTSKYPLAVESSVGPHPGAGG